MSLHTQGIHLEQDSLNIVSNKNDEKILDDLIDLVGAFPRDIEAKFHSKLLRLSREKIKIASQVAGCKLTLAKTIADTIFERFYEASTQNYRLLDQETLPNSCDRHFMYTTRIKFHQILREEFKKNNLQKERSILDFELALDILEQTKSIMILLGGTSGSGKSTVGSLLASRFGIPTVLSTDSIRHVMRNFMTNEECPVLFCSTYEAGKKIQLDEEVKETKRITMGFQQQAAAVQQRLAGILEGFHKRGESIVVEGVHLTPDFMIEMVKKFNNCVPFLIYISNENKHRERFAVRSKYMTLEKRLNKYVENFASIRCIQKYLTKKAEEFLIPKVDNSNIDKSVGIVHRTMVRCLRRISVGESLYDFENNKALKVYEQFNAVTKNIWSSDAVKKYIRAKSKKTYKSEIFKRFFEQNAKPMNKDLQFKIEPEQRQALLDLNTNKENINPVNNLEQDDDDDKSFTKNRTGTPPLLPSKSKAKPTVSFKEDLILIDSPPKAYVKEENSLPVDNFEGDKSDEEFSPREHFSESPERARGVRSSDHQNNESLTKEEEAAMDLNLILGATKSFTYGEEANVSNGDHDNNSVVSKSQENFSKISFKETAKTNSMTKMSKIKSEEVKVEENSGLSPRYGIKGLGKFNLLEDMLITRKVITVKGLTSYNVNNLRKFINDYNSKHHRDSILKIYPDTTQQRYIIYKHNKYEKDNSPGLAKPLEGTKRGFMRFATKRFDDYAEKTPTNNESSSKKHQYNNTSDDNEASDEGSKSEASQENWSNMSDSLNVNTYLIKRGSTYNMSDKFDLSDEAESMTIPEGKEDTSLEFLQSGNSISEQTIEEDEDEESDTMFNNDISPTHLNHPTHHTHPTHSVHQQELSLIN